MKLSGICAVLGYFWWIFNEKGKIKLAFCFERNTRSGAKAARTIRCATFSLNQELVGDTKAYFM